MQLMIKLLNNKTTPLPHEIIETMKFTLNFDLILFHIIIVREVED